MARRLRSIKSLSIIEETEAIAIDTLLAERRSCLNQHMLNRYIGGQVVLAHHTNDILAGFIEEISLIANTVEVECGIVARTPIDNEAWKVLERHDGFVVVELAHGWKALPDGAIQIIGANGRMSLFPKKSAPFSRAKLFGE